MKFWNLHEILFILEYAFVIGRSVLEEINVFEVAWLLLKIEKDETECEILVKNIMLILQGM